MRDAYIVTAVRTPGCRRAKGAFKDTRPEDLLSFILNAAVERTPGLEKGQVDDVMIGCSFPEAEQGLNIGRVASQIAGFPHHVSGATVNRFCSSGLEAIAQSAMRVMCGWSEITIGGGLESMTYVPMGGNMARPHPEYTRERPDLYISMGMTAENVAKRYNITRQDQDQFGYESQMKASKAKAEKLYTELVPTSATRFVLQKDGTYKKETFIQDFDDGIRESTTLEGLAKLRPAFSPTGSVTAGNSSQTTDGAAASVIMSEQAVKELGLKPIAKLKYYTTVGCRADEMGVGPRYAIPKLLKLAGMTIDDIGLWRSTRLSPPRRSTASANSVWSSTWTGSTFTAGPSPWATPWGVPAPSCAPRCWPTCAPRGSSTASSPCASAAAWGRRPFSNCAIKTLRSP